MFPQALARSCNVSFARMGQAAGFAALADLLRRFFFNAPPFTDQFCSFATGSFDRPGRAMTSGWPASPPGWKAYP